MVFIDWFLPAYKAGGQIPSVYNIIKLLKDEVDFSVVTSNSDEGEPAFPDLEFNKWLTNFGVRIIYLSPEKQTLAFFKQLFKSEQFDKVYFNSFFSFRFTILPLLALKTLNKNFETILAPRGMLGKGALQIKALKKKTFLYVAKWLGLYKNITWHASSEFEVKEIKAIFGRKAQKIKTAIDISILPKAKTIEKNKKPDELKLFFLSRITDKKNLLGAINLLQEQKSGTISFDIIGPIGNSEYWKKCQVALTTLPQNIKTNYLGAIPNYLLSEKLKQYHFFLFPTFNENYGHVIAESLASGCPVILSDNTPWSDLEENNAGWIIPLPDKGKYKSIINKALKLNKSEYNQMANNALSYLTKRIHNNNIIEDNKKIFF